MLNLFVLSIDMLNPSTIKMIKKGDSGSPSLDPIETPQNPLGLLLTITKEFMKLKQPLIHVYLFSNPFFNTKFKKSQS